MVLLVAFGIDVGFHADECRFDAERFKEPVDAHILVAEGKLGMRQPALFVALDLARCEQLCSQPFERNEAVEERFPCRGREVEPKRLCLLQYLVALRRFRQPVDSADKLECVLRQVHDAVRARFRLIRHVVPPFNSRGRGSRY